MRRFKRRFLVVIGLALLGGWALWQGRGGVQRRPPAVGERVSRPNGPGPSGGQQAAGSSQTPSQAGLTDLSAAPTMGRIEGIVSDEYGRTLPGASVWSQVAGQARPVITPAAVTSNGEGWFSLAGLPLGSPLEIEARAAGYFQSDRLLCTLSASEPAANVSIVLEHGGGMSGRVTDEAGQPIGGATVAAGAREGHYAVKSRSFAAETDGDGRYVIAGLPAGKCWVTAGAGGYCGVRRGEVVVALGAATEGVDFMLGRGLRVSGRVVSLVEGREVPEPGAIVQAYCRLSGDLPGPVPYTGDRITSSGALGAFELTGLASPAEYTFQVQKGLRAGDRQPTLPLPEGAGATTLTLTLPASGALRVRLVDAQERPIAGATARMPEDTVGRYTGWHSGIESRMHWKPEQPRFAATSDGEGRMVFDDLERETSYTLAFEAAGFALKLAVLAADPAVEHQVVLTRGGTIAGVVVLAGSNVPLAGMEMALSQIGRQAPPTRVETDVAGKFRFALVPVGTYDLQGTLANEGREALVARLEEPLELREGDGKEIRLEALAGATVRGTVRTGKGQPLAKAMVTFEDRSTTSALDGTYRLDGLAPGRRMGRASKPGYVEYFQTPEQAYSVWEDPGSRSAKEIVCEPGATIDGVDFVLHDVADDPQRRWVDVRGIVLDPQGEPAPGVEVFTRYVSGGFDSGTFNGIGKVVLTDGAGRFNIRERRQRVSGVVVFPTKERLTYGSATWQEPEITCRLMACGRIRGIVARPDGTPVAEADVLLQPQTTDGFPLMFGMVSGGFVLESRTDRDGLFSFDPTRWGSLRIYANKQGMRRAGSAGEKEFRLEPGETAEDVVLLLEPETAFRGRLADATGRPLAGWRFGPVQTDAEGRFSYQLVEGDNQFEIRSDQQLDKVHRWFGYHTGSIDFPRAQPPAELTFSLPPTGVVRGRVVEETTGRPPQQLWAELSTVQSDSNAPRGFAEVVLRHSGWQSSEPLATDGELRIDEVPAGTHRLSLSGPEVVGKGVEPIVVRAGAITDLGEIRLTAGATVTGRLIDGRTGQPLSGAGYEINRWSLPLEAGGTAVLKGPDPTGRFQLSPLATTLQSLAFTARTLSSSQGMIGRRGAGPTLFGAVNAPPLKMGGTSDVGDVVLRLYRLRGRFVDAAGVGPVAFEALKDFRAQMDGGPNGSSVHFNRQDFKETGAGDWTIEGIRPDANRVRLRFDGYRSVEIGPLPAAGPEGTIDLGAIRLDPGRVVRGVVLAPDGAPVARAFVQINQGNDYQYVNADEGGRFAASGLRPGAAELFAQDEAGRLFVAENMSLTLPETGDLEIPVRLVPRPR